MKAWLEDLPLDFTRPETRAAERLLITGYPTNMEALTLARDAGLDLARLNQMAPVKFLMHDILVKARLADRLIQLLAEVLSDPAQEALHEDLRGLVLGHEASITTAAMRRKPSLSILAMLPSSIEVLRPKGAGSQPLSTPGLEKTINAAAGFADPAVFRLRLAEAEVRTARIDVGGKAKGTAFLIADSLLLSNWHVVSGGVDGAVAVFDNQVSPLSKTKQDGRAVKFADNWLVASSIHERSPVEIGVDGPPSGTWDFAVIRLVEPVGSQALGPDPMAQEAERRGRYILDGGSYHFEEAEPLFIVGHPEGRPVQFSYASPSGVRSTKNLNRVRYQTNTEGGSSGSPVFNREWRIVALHHAAGPTSTPGEFNMQTGDFNQGIPISGIVGELKKQLSGRPELAELGLA